jgi:GTP cyclohydrolase I
MSKVRGDLHENKNMINMKNFPDILKSLKSRLDAESAYMIIRFPYFIKKEAPVSKTQSYMEYPCGLWGSIDSNNVMKEFVASVSVPINTLCPCSKEISEYGAHNQRGIAKVEVKVKKFFLDGRPDKQY